MGCFVRGWQKGTYFISVAKTAWDVLYGVANLCRMFCLGRLKVACRTLVKGAYQKINFFISHLKHMLWVLKKTSQ